MKLTKTTIATTALILLLTISATIVALPIVSAHDPAWSVKTYVYISVTPNPVGVNQDLLIFMWLNECPPTAAGPYGDRWHTLGVEITLPDGTTETLGPFDSDPAGGTYTIYVPTQVGTYKLQGTFGGETLAGDNLNPTDFRGRDYIGDYYEPSRSDIMTLTVQQDPIPAYEDTPLPDRYWERPINAQHRNWWSISGNWLYPLLPERRVQLYSEGPETAHILWTKELTIGGLVGGNLGTLAYQCGSAYEAKFTPPVIIAGTLYINKYPNDIKNAGEFRAEGPKPGVLAIDIRTGEEIWYNPNMSRISFGQIYMFDSMNQHGAFAYLWSTMGSTWTAYEAYTGDKVCTIENVSGGTLVYGSKGEILRYRLNTKKDYLTLWNNTAMPELRAGLNYYAHMWRPYGKTIDAKTGYEWNVTIPADLEGKIEQVLDDRIIGSSGLGRPGWTGDIENYTVWALSLKPGEEGKLLWKKDYTAPYSNVVMTMTQCAMSQEDGVFTVFCAETREWFGYDLDNGELLWGPTESQGAWDIYYETASVIAYGKLYSCGMSGIVYCYDIKTGTLEWANGVLDLASESMFGNYYPLQFSVIADGKVYAFASEHSPSDPKGRGYPLVCFDAFTGEIVWQIPMYFNRWGGVPPLADGILIHLNAYDNQLYSFGKGPTKTTVTAPDTAVSQGSSVVIRGTVTDESPGTESTLLTALCPNGVPAISDEDQSAWMEYVYMQKPMPQNVEGVDVLLMIQDPNGDWYQTTVTSDINGVFSHMWAPAIVGEYHVTAMFEGSESYYTSQATTAFGIDQAPAPPVVDYPDVPTADEIAQKTISQLPAYPEVPDVPSAEEVAQETINRLPAYPEMPEIPETPAYLTIDLAIIAAVAIAIIIGLYSIVKKQK